MPIEWGYGGQEVPDGGSEDVMGHVMVHPEMAPGMSRLVASLGSPIGVMEDRRFLMECHRVPSVMSDNFCKRVPL